MRLPLIRFAAAFVLAALFVKVDAFAQVTKLSVGYVCGNDSKADSCGTVSKEVKPISAGRNRWAYRPTG
jgi:hypothetical protein